MGLTTILRKLKEKEREIRILILGLDNAGKSTFVQNILHEDVNTVVPTVGFQIKSLLYKEYTVNIWDVGGQLCLRTFWRNYFESTDGLIWVVDSSDKQRLEDCAVELHKLLKEEKLLGSPLLVLANKRDLPESFDSNLIKEYLQLENLKNRKWVILETSSIHDEKSDGSKYTKPLEAFDWIVSHSVHFSFH